MVQDIERLCSELQVEALRDLEILQQARIEIPIIGTLDSITTAAVLPRWWNAEVCLGASDFLAVEMWIIQRARDESVRLIHHRTDRSGHWLENSILHLVEEAASGRVGSEAMLAKLSEALFVDTLRRYVASLPEQQTGWLSGTRDPIVGRSLGLLHSRIAYPWTIANLAEQVGVSRSTLVERFTRYLSEPPMTYLTRWRLQFAARSLERTSRGVADIAADVGYESEAAFNRAFKREFGQPPGRYRSDQRRPNSVVRGAPDSCPPVHGPGV